jgi:hypothetical protein
MDLQETPKKIQDESREPKIDSRSKILFAVISLLIVGSVAVTFWRYVMRRDYIVQAQIDCDPEMEKCFVWECDPNSAVEGEACTGDEESDIWYYKTFRRNAKNIPMCDPNDEDCTAYVCDPSEDDCSEELCTDENVPEGESCNDPEQYLLENPPEEESECAEDDEECLAEKEAAECDEGDEECASLEEEECDPEDQECLDADSAEEETCSPDDESCISEDDGEGENDVQEGADAQEEE